jgi:hypothetical protein
MSARLYRVGRFYYNCIIISEATVSIDENLPGIWVQIYHLLPANNLSNYFVFLSPNYFILETITSLLLRVAMRIEGIVHMKHIKETEHILSAQ